MLKLLGAAVAAVTLAFAGSASAWSSLATFETVGSGPTVQVDPAFGPEYRPGATAVDTIRTVNVLFQWHRIGVFLYPKYDELDALVALGPLAGILTIDARPTTYEDPRNTTSYGRMSILYAGPSLSVNGQTFEAGDTLVRGGFRNNNSTAGGFYSDFFQLPAGLGQMDFEYLNQTPNGDGWVADVAGSFSAPVPEPATWAMMIIGFGLVGSGVRLSRRRPSVLGT